MSTSNGLAARDDQIFSPGSWSKTYTVVGLSVGASTTWHARIVAKEGDDQSSPLLSATVAVDGGANTVTFSLTAAQVATLMSTGAKKFHGFWSVYNDTLARQLVTGSFVVDRTAGNTGSTTTPSTLTVTSTTTTLTVLSEQASFSSKVSVFAVTDYGTVDQTGATDSTTAVQAAITAAAATGGIVQLPAGIIKCTSQLTVPADGTGAIASGAVKQRPIVIRGAGAYASGQNTSALGGTRLRLTYTSGSYNDAKFVTYGLGSLTLEDITFEDTTANATTPFLYTTNTTLHVNRCAFIGATSGTSCAQDAIVLGGTTKPISTGYGDTDSAFQGYGTTVKNSYFNNVRRTVYGRSYCNQVVVADNFFDKGCGSNLAGGACVEFDGSLPATEASVADGDYCTANVVTGNYFENIGYVYGVKLTKAAFTIVSANGFEDPGGSFVAAVRCAGAVSAAVNYPAQDNLIMGNFVYNGVALSEDTMSTGRNNVLGAQISGGVNVLAAPELRHTGNTLSIPTAQTWEIKDVAGNSLLSQVAGSARTWVTGGAMRIDGNSNGAGSTYLTVGNNSNASDALINLNPPTGQSATLQFGLAGTTQFQLYTAAAGSLLFLRDMVNGRMLATFTGGTAGNAVSAFLDTVQADKFRLGASGPVISYGTGSPNGAVTGSPGDVFLRTNGSVGQSLYRKETGTATNTGWVTADTGRVLSTVSSDVTFSNSVADNALASLAIPTTAAAGEQYVVEAWGEFTNNSGGNVTYTWRLKLGATSVLLSAAQSYATSATKRQFNLRAVVLVKATNSELVKADLQIGGNATADTWALLSTNSLYGNGSAAEDLTAGKALALSCQMGTANASASVTLHGAALTSVPI